MLGTLTAAAKSGAISLSVKPVHPDTLAPHGAKLIERGPGRPSAMEPRKVAAEHKYFILLEPPDHVGRILALIIPCHFIFNHLLR